MKILQMTHDWKWTGPAEPMLRLGLALRERGHQVGLACPDSPSEEGGVASYARVAGMAPDILLQAAKGVRPLADRGDVARLRDYICREGVELVHTWHTRDHLLALRTARGLPASLRPAILRSYRIGETIPAWPWNRWLFGPGCDGLLCVSPGIAEANRRLRGGRPITGSFGAVDFERFGPQARNPEIRASLGLSEEHHVVGVVARIQRHRRFDLLLAAAARLFEADPLARLLVIGRGTHRREVAIEPAERMGLSDRICFAGYFAQGFEEVLRAMDVLTFLVPGSDGTCRAVLEAAACGIPVVATRRGALAEIVEQGETGVLVDEEPEDLAAAWLRIFSDPVLRQRMGEATARRARERFTPERFADEVECLYGEVLHRGAKAPR